MAQYSFAGDTGSHTTLNLNGTGGNVRIEGIEHDRIEIEGDAQVEQYLRREGDTVTLTGYPVDVHIRLPKHSSVDAKGVGAEVEARSVGHGEAATFVCRGVGGSVRLENVPNIDVDGIGGHLKISGDADTVQAGQIGGHLEVERAGRLSFRAVGGNANLASVEQLGGMGNVGGELKLKLTGSFEGSSRVNVGGSANIELPHELSLALTAMTGGSISGSGDGWEVRGGSGNHSFVFGEGTNTLSLVVGGDLRLSGGSNVRYNGSQDWGEWSRNFEGMGEEMRGLGREMEDLGRTLARDLGTLGRDISREVRIAGREAMRGVYQREPGMRSGRGPRVRVQFNEHDVTLEPEQVERIKREARAAAAAGVARAQEAVERALKQWEQRSPRPGRPVPPVPPVPPTPPRAPFTGQTVRIDREESSTVTEMPTPPAGEQSRDLDAERLAILRMVHEGRIAPDEAEVLLRGLEGRA